MRQNALPPRPVQHNDAKFGPPSALEAPDTDNKTIGLLEGGMPSIVAATQRFTMMRRVAIRYRNIGGWRGPHTRRGEKYEVRKFDWIPGLRMDGDKRHQNGEVQLTF